MSCKDAGELGAAAVPGHPQPGGQRAAGGGLVRRSGGRWPRQEGQQGGVPAEAAAGGLQHGLAQTLRQEEAEIHGG